MVCVERDLAEPGRDHAVEGKGQKRLLKDGNEWLGEEIGQRRKAGAETCGQNEGGGCGHRTDSASRFSERRRIASAAQAAPKPLSMLVTVTPLAQLFTMPSRAAIPSKLAP